VYSIYIATEVVLPAEESLETMEIIRLPDVISNTFGNLTPTFEVPVTVILNQMDKKGSCIILRMCVTKRY